MSQIARRGRWFVLAALASMLLAAGCSPKRVPTAIPKEVALAAAGAVVEEVLDEAIRQAPEGNGKQALLAVRTLLRIKETRDRQLWLLGPVRKALKEGGGSKRLAREAAKATLTRFLSEKTETQVKKLLAATGTLGGLEPRPSLKFQPLVARLEKGETTRIRIATLFPVERDVLVFLEVAPSLAVPRPLAQSDRLQAPLFVTLQRGQTVVEFPVTAGRAVGTFTIVARTSTGIADLRPPTTTPSCQISVR
jgi:hypothetical protein